MDINKQTQQAGDGSQQFQAGTIIINQGITEERAREIYKELVPQTISEYTKDAYALANERIGKLEDAVLERTKTAPEVIPAFSDPAFQRTLRKAQQAAAVTDEKMDYELLTELLVCHVQKGKERMYRAGIEKAIEIVDLVDNEALCGLTVAHVLERFSPVAGDVTCGLEVLEEVYKKLVYQELPQGEGWLDHLDTLGAMRMSQIGGLNKFIDYYPKVLNGYACVGIEQDSGEYEQADDLLQSIGLEAKTSLKPNEFLRGYTRLEVRSMDQIANLIIVRNGVGRKITSEEKSVFEKVWRLYNTDEVLQKQVDMRFVEKWDSYPTLKKVHEWWDGISTGFYITKVGETLAHTNAKRCDPTIPDLV